MKLYEMYCSDCLYVESDGTVRNSGKFYIVYTPSMQENPAYCPCCGSDEYVENTGEVIEYDRA